MRADTAGTNLTAGRSRALLLITVLAFGTVGLLVKQIALPAGEIALYRAAIALLVLLVIMAFTGRFSLLVSQLRSLWPFLLSGAVMGFNWMVLFTAYNFTSVALGTLAYYVAPSLMMLAGVLFLKERLSRFQLLCFVLSSLGLVLILGASGGQPGDAKGVLLALGAAFLYATVITINRAAPQVDGILRTFVQFVAAILVMLPYNALNGGFHLQSLPPSGWLWLLVLGVVHTGICYSLYFLAIPRLSGQQVAIFSYLDPLVAVLLSVLLLGERISALQLLGGAIMVAFALLNELHLSRQIKQEGAGSNPS